MSTRSPGWRVRKLQGGWVVQRRTPFGWAGYAKYVTWAPAYGHAIALATDADRVLTAFDFYNPFDT